MAISNWDNNVIVHNNTKQLVLDGESSCYNNLLAGYKMKFLIVFIQAIS